MAAHNPNSDGYSTAEIDRAVRRQRAAEDNALIRRGERAEPLVDHRHQLVGDESAPPGVARILLLPVRRLREHRDHRRNRLVRDQVIEHAWGVHLLDVIRSVEHVHHGKERVGSGVVPGRQVEPHPARAAKKSRRQRLGDEFAPAAPNRLHRFPAAPPRTACALPTAVPQTPAPCADSSDRRRPPCRRRTRTRAAHSCTTCSRDTTTTTPRCASACRSKRRTPVASSPSR